MKLAEEVRSLFGEVAAEGLGFDDIARGEGLPPEAAGELARWDALARAQQGMAAALAAEGLTDPHLARLAAIEAGRVQEPRAVVLVGVVESTGLLRRALDLCSAPKIALLLAPKELLSLFDDHGGLVPQAWIDRGTSIELDHWNVVEGPDDQAAAAVDAIAMWDGRFAAEEITIGLADAEVAPYLHRRLAAVGAHSRDAAGVPIGRSAPVRLLEAAGAYLAGRRYSDYAALVRHPDLEAHLRLSAPELEAISILDRYQPEHLPRAGDGEWFGKRRADLATLSQAVHAALGGLASADGQPLRAWAGATREFLQRIYGDRQLDDSSEADRQLAAGLSQLSNALEELEGLPESLEWSGDAPAMLTLLARMVAGGYLPPPAAEGDASIELLGWLELAQDDAPAVVITGFNDGMVPESLRGDAFLPDGLRRSLGLIDDDRRLARDLYASEVLVHSRTECVFLTGRRSLAGDPMLPSRILFHCKDEDLLDRVTRFVDGGHVPSQSADASDATRALPRWPVERAVDSIAVTAFRAYIDSPYAFYLTRVLRLDTGDDRGRELDPMGFGILAHEALETWGKDEVARDEGDPGRIAAGMVGALRSVARRRFGDDPLPAVALQIEQLAWRLERLAQAQARWYADGWRIRHVEWGPEDGGVPFDVDGVPIQLRGRIDRIDENLKTGQFALLDYKSGEKAADPLRAHRKRTGDWADLQLPLYTRLAHPLIGAATPLLGYVTLGKDNNEIGFRTLDNFSPTKKAGESMQDGLDSAFELALEIVRKIRRDEFFDIGRWRPSEPIWSAIGGLGLVASLSAQGEEEA